MFIPTKFSWREIPAIPIVEVTGECDKKYPYVFLVKVALSIIENAECYEGKLMQYNYKDVPTDKNRIFFALIFPNMEKRNEFRNHS